MLRARESDRGSTRRHGRRALLLWLPVLLAVWFLGPVVWAHDMWIEPPKEPVGAGELVRVPLVVGHGGEADPVRRNPRRILRFTASGPVAEVEVMGMPGATPAGSFRPGQEGIWLVGYESTAAFSELGGERFERYLAEEGLVEISRRRQRRGEASAPGRELYSRSLKSLVQVGSSELQDRWIGLPLELVLETVSSGSPESGGGEGEGVATLRLVFRGRPLVGARIDLRRSDEAEPHAVGTTDSRGRVALPIGGGSWVAAAVHMEPTTGPETKKADWRSWFATSTFRLE